MKPTNVSLPILYEDDQLLIVDKPDHMLSHPDKLLKAPDLLTQVKRLYPKLATLDIQVITRLDFNTSGLCLLSKYKATQKNLQYAQDQEWVKKIYQCVVFGYLPKTSDVLMGYLLKDETSAVVRISPTEVDNTLPIRTKYTVLKEKNGLSLLEVELLSGKTHQIRAHLAAIGYPLVGDPLYGNLMKNRQYPIKTQQLVMSKLRFEITDSNHPLAYLDGVVVQKKDVDWSIFSF